MDIKKVPDILLKIVETKKKEIAELSVKQSDLKMQALDSAPALDFKAALSKSGLSVIAEIKRASPSAGIIADDFNPEKIAAAYSNGKADAASVLTDVQYFKGRPEYIPAVRQVLKGIPILRKDFIIHASQIYEARALGADSFLLISAILTLNEMQDFIGIGRELGMEPLVESHTETELDKSIDAGSEIFGINNRDLHTFTMDLATSENLFLRIPQNALKVSESGICSPQDAHRMRKAGFDAILAGESLMRSGPEKCAETIASFKKETL